MPWLNYKKNFWILCLFFCLLGLSPGQAFAGKTLTLRADNWCPYNCAPQDPQQGYVIDIVRAVFEPKGYMVDYALEPWSRALEDVRAGVFDGAVAASADDGQGLLLGPAVVGVNNNALAVRKGEGFVWKDVSVFKGKKLGAALGYDYNPTLNAYIDAHKNDKFALDLISGDAIGERHLQKLLAGRVDIVVDNRHVLNAVLKKEQWESKVDLIPLPDNEPLYVGFTKAKPEGKILAAQLAEGLDALRKSGKLKEILDKYGVPDWAPLP